MLQELMDDVRSCGEEGVICEFWTVSCYHLTIHFLTELGLVKPISTKIPACADHWCKLNGDCCRRRIFDRRVGTRGGLKGRLTTVGRTAFGDPAVLSHLLGRHRIVQTIRAAVAEQPQSIFELHSRLLDGCRDETDINGMVETNALRRIDLRGGLELLESLGEVTWDRPTGMVSAAPCGMEQEVKATAQPVP